MIIAVLCVAILSVTDSWQVVDVFGVLLLGRHTEFGVLVLAHGLMQGLLWLQTCAQRV